MSNFKDHFSGHAQKYSSSRPRYPDELFVWILSQAPSNSLVWDVGCGNGQASVGLSRYFESVFASDPSAEQIESAETHPNIRYSVEPAEQCSLATNSASSVCVAQALHWFDFKPFFAEVKRVLQVNGIFVAWTYGLSNVNADVDVAFLNLYKNILNDYWPPERKHVETGYREIEFPFVNIESPRFVLACDWNLSQYLAYLRSWSASERYLKTQGHDAVGLIEKDMTRAWGDPGRVRSVTWPITVKAGVNRD